MQLGRDTGPDQARGIGQVLVDEEVERAGRDEGRRQARKVLGSGGSRMVRNPVRARLGAAFPLATKWLTMIDIEEPVTGGSDPTLSPAILRARVARLALERIADRLREIAMFSSARTGQEDILVLAEELSELAQAERRVTEALEDAGPIKPWALRARLGLKSAKAARLLGRFLRTPSTFLHRDVLIRAVETTPTSLIALIWDIRRALAPLGLRAELQRMDNGYVLSQAGAEAICAHCSSERLAAQLAAEGIALSHERPQLQPPSNGTPPSDFAVIIPPYDPARVERLSSVVRLLLEFRTIGQQAEGGEVSANPGLLDVLGRLSPLALELILILAANPGMFVNRPSLAKCIGSTDGSLKILILRIRKNFLNAGVPDPIETRWGCGYRLTSDALCTLAEMADALIQARLGTPTDAMQRRISDVRPNGPGQPNAPVEGYSVIL